MINEATQQTLLQRAREFDLQALAEIYDLFSPVLYRYAVRLLNDAEMAEDCVTETFSRFLSALKANRGPREHLRAYLYRIAHNWITDHYRLNKPVTASLDNVENAPAIDHQEPNPLQTVMDKLVNDHIRSAITLLTPEQRQVIVLKYYEGMDNEEIAAAMGKPIAAVKSLHQRALASLRRSLRAVGDRAGVADELQLETG